MHKSFSNTVAEMIQTCDHIFEINNYQRFYVWSTEKVETYIDDILATIAYVDRDPNSIHYFGQMIFLETRLDDRGRKVHEVIDGQQRISSFLMLVAAIKGFCQKICSDFPDTAKEAAALEHLCQTYLVSAKQDATIIPKLSLAPQDNSYYQIILHHLAENLEVPRETRPISHQCLYSAQLAVKDKLTFILQNLSTPTEKIQKLNQLIKAATESFQITALILKKETYSYQLYQVVNDRGEPLKDSELLKAKSMEVLKENASYINTAKDIWNDILQDPGPDTQKYLTWCYMSKVGSDKGETRLLQSYLKHYFRIPEHTLLSQEEQEQFIQDLKGLHKDIQLCRKLARGEWPFENPTCPNWQRNVLSNLIVGMKHTLCIPVLLSAFHQPTHHGLTTEQNFYKCLELCETCFMLIKSVFHMREDKFKTKYLAAAVHMRETPTAYRFAQFKEELKQIEPVIVKRECLNRLQSMVYTPKTPNSALKYLLILLETYAPAFDAQNNLHLNNIPDGTNLVYSELSIEHIYAENVAAAEADADLEPLKHKLGNLLPYGKNANSRLKSKPYADKIPYYRNSRFLTVQQLIAAHPTTWTGQNCIDRQNDVCEKLQKLLLRYYE